MTFETSLQLQSVNVSDLVIFNLSGRSGACQGRVGNLRLLLETLPLLPLTSLDLSHNVVGQAGHDREDRTWGHGMAWLGSRCWKWRHSAGFVGTVYDDRPGELPPHQVEFNRQLWGNGILWSRTRLFCGWWDQKRRSNWTPFCFWAHLWQYLCGLGSMSQTCLKHMSQMETCLAVWLWERKHHELTLMIARISHWQCVNEIPHSWLLQDQETLFLQMYFHLRYRKIKQNCNRLRRDFFSRQQPEPPSCAEQRCAHAARAAPGRLSSTTGTARQRVAAAFPWQPRRLAGFGAWQLGTGGAGNG